jgi:hypothetical protein
MKKPGRIEFPSQVATRRTAPLWTSEDVADALQVSLRGVENQGALGVLPCALPGRSLIRYDSEEIRARTLGRAPVGTYAEDHP